MTPAPDEAGRALAEAAREGAPLPCPPIAWIAEQAERLSGSKDQDAIGALAVNLTSAFHRWLDHCTAGRPPVAGTAVLADIPTQLAALISVWRGVISDCRLTGDPDMGVTALAMANCADQAEALLKPPQETA